MNKPLMLMIYFSIIKQSQMIDFTKSENNKVKSKLPYKKRKENRREFLSLEDNYSSFNDTSIHYIKEIVSNELNINRNHIQMNPHIFGIDSSIFSNFQSEYISSNENMFKPDKKSDTSDNPNYDKIIIKPKIMKTCYTYKKSDDSKILNADDSSGHTHDWHDFKTNSQLSKINEKDKICTKEDNIIPKKINLGKRDYSMITDTGRYKKWENIPKKHEYLKFFLMTYNFIDKFSNSNPTIGDIFSRIREEVPSINFTFSDYHNLLNYTNRLPFNYRNLRAKIKNEIHISFISYKDISLQDMFENFSKLKESIYKSYIDSRTFLFLSRQKEIDEINFYEENYSPILSVEDYACLNLKMHGQWNLIFNSDERVKDTKIVITYIQAQLKNFYNKYKDNQFLKTFFNDLFTVLYVYDRDNLYNDFEFKKQFYIHENIEWIEKIFKKIQTFAIDQDNYEIPKSGLLKILEIRVLFIFRLFNSISVNSYHKYLYILRCIASYIISSHDRYYAKREKIISEKTFSICVKKCLRKFSKTLESHEYDLIKWAETFFSILEADIS